MNQCQGKTQDGSQCKRKTKNKYCYQHCSGLSSVLTYSLSKNHSITISKKVHGKLTTLIKKGPSKEEKPGHIYVYYHENDPVNYWKIGRTTQPVTKRLSQWSLNKIATLKQSYKVKDTKYTERLIHLFLDEKRVYRYWDEETRSYYTIKKSDGSPVGNSREKKPNVTKKEIEWFICEYALIEILMNIITQKTNEHCQNVE